MKNSQRQRHTRPDPNTDDVADTVNVAWQDPSQT